MFLCHDTNKDKMYLSSVQFSCTVVSNSLQLTDYSPPGCSIQGDSPGKNTGVVCRALLQGIFPTQVSCTAGGFFIVSATGEAISESPGSHHINPIPTYCRCFIPLPAIWMVVVGGLVAKFCPTLSIPWTVACQVPLSMGFFRWEYWSVLPFNLLFIDRSCFRVFNYIA